MFTSNCCFYSFVFNIIIITIIIPFYGPKLTRKFHLLRFFSIYSAPWSFPFLQLQIFLEKSLSKYQRDFINHSIHKHLLNTSYRKYIKLMSEYTQTCMFKALRKHVKETLHLYVHKENMSCHPLLNGLGGKVTRWKEGISRVA